VVEGPVDPEDIDPSQRYTLGDPAFAEIRLLLRKVDEEVAALKVGIERKVAYRRQLEAIAIQNGHSRELELLSKPLPKRQPLPMARVKALRPFTVWYERAYAPEDLLILKAHGQPAESVYQEAVSLGDRHVLDVPASEVDRLVKEGAAERVAPNA
jgi:xanthine/CO dehydrogenase XdhC/CoxF family maturation factor